MTPPPLPNNPPDVVDGPRKRRPTERVTGNGDPLVQKKARTTSSTVNLKAMSTRTTASTSTTKKATATGVKTMSLSRRASFEDIAEPAPAPPSQPCNTARILEAADSSDDDHNDDYTGMPQLIDVEESDDEDEEDEDEPEDNDTDLVSPRLHLSNISVNNQT